MLSLLGFLKWAARVTSVVLISVIILFALGEGGNSPTMNEIIGLLFFPVGIMIGLIVAFKRTSLGGIIAVSSLIMFYIWHYITKHQFPDGFGFLVFTAPAVLFLLYAYLDSRWRNKHS